MADRPIIRCLVARTLRDGNLSRTKIVSLAEAFVYRECGFYVVGPDPEDMEALATWERAQQERDPP